MKLTILVPLISSVLFSCASTPTRSEYDSRPSEPNKVSKIEVKRSPKSDQAEVTGKTYFIKSDSGRPSVSPATLAKIEKIVEEALRQKGYEKAKDQKSSHLRVVIQSGYQSPSSVWRTSPLDIKGAVRISPTQTQKVESVFKDGKLIGHRSGTFNGQSAYLMLGLLIFDHGKRPDLGGQIVFDAWAEEWTGQEEALLELLDKEVDELITPAPSQNKVMKGPPGCGPRFGYEVDGAKIIHIIKGSPAEKAGIQVGDLLLAIDSSSPRLEVSSDVYESRTQVPVKLQRDDKVVRTSIRAEILCE